ncbi:MAG: hypothetical protein ACE363_05955 [Alphaproteobacteria bacterium]
MRVLPILMGLLCAFLSAPVANAVAGADSVSFGDRQVLTVTSLADTGPGSLRAVIESSSGPRDIVFSVGGIIDLRAPLTIRSGNLRILGESAPAPGITLRGNTLEIKRGRVFISHIAVRIGPGVPGRNADNRDGISVSGSPDLANCTGQRHVAHVVIDHVSVVWAVDENVQLWGCNIRKVTVSNSIIAEGLNNAGHSKGPHSMGFLVGIGARDVLIYNNLFVSNRWRNPALHADTTSAVINNLIHNPGGNAIHLYKGRNGQPTKVSMVGNLVIGGPSSATRLAMGHTRKNAVNPGSQIYMFGNLMEGNIMPFAIDEVAGLQRMQAPPVAWPDDLVILSPYRLEESLLRMVGPQYRDETDMRLIEEVRQRGGSIKDVPPPQEWARP